MTKKELTQIHGDDCCVKAELSALIQMVGALHVSESHATLDITTENAAIARRFYTLLKQRYENMKAELVVRKKMRLRKNNIYIVRVYRLVEEILADTNLTVNEHTFSQSISEHIFRDNCCKRAYLRGAFLAGGSINHPETSSYHLELFSYHKEHNQSLLELMSAFDLDARVLDRKKGYIVYLKESEKITEFLNIIGAHQALLYFEDVRIVKDMRNSVNRLVNCETANLNKTVGAALRQVENIELVAREIGLESLPPKVREMAELRVRHQDVTLKELGEMVENGKVSKSGVNHRLRKIDELAERIRDRESLPQG
ncbi:DNA-binding protein WhiA [Salicibibacter kimchii]|uniref:Probable cell division protein WhiA n=1 Tax=Salicibibacter kimchii TaxID=2099786 RepID=A0A345C414_9BACI|nr:DNA-binding protein WhiA [Salicibibacter kimchii]AXF57945.1 DNA-binding protein WhiA [Salicibibacter kimchii]